MDLLLIIIFNINKNHHVHQYHHNFYHRHHLHHHHRQKHHHHHYSIIILMITIIIIIFIINPFLGMLNSSFLFCSTLTTSSRITFLQYFGFLIRVLVFSFFKCTSPFLQVSSTYITAHLFCFHIHSNSSFLVLFICLYHSFLWYLSAYILSCKSRLTLFYTPRLLFAYVPKILSWIKENLCQIQ